MKNKRNNNPNNLEIKSRSEHSREHFKLVILSEEKNAIKKEKLSLSNSGEKSYMAILTEKDVVIIKQKLKNGSRVVDLANEFGVDRRTIGDIKYSRSWKHVKFGDIV